MSSKFKKFFVSNRISLYTIGGVISGLLCGLLVKLLLWPGDAIVDPYFLRYASLPGTIYIRAFLALIVPLLVSSLSTSLLYSEKEQNEQKLNNSQTTGFSGQKLLLTTLIMFACFSTFATILSITLMSIFTPGTLSTVNVTIRTTVLENLGSEEALIRQAQRRIEQTNFRVDSILNIILNLFPENLALMLFATPYTKTDVIWPVNLSAILDPAYVPTLKQTTTYTFRPNMIGICVIAFLLGILLKSLGPDRARTVRQLLKEMDHLVSVSFSFLLRFMPGGMFCWMFAEALKMHSIKGIAVQLGYFYALLTGAFCALNFVFYPVVYFLFTRGNAFKLYKALVPAILVALGSTSSAITLPVTLKCMEGKGRLSAPIAQTVLPLGMTIHMNGCALYYSAVALFVAQCKEWPTPPLMLIILGLFALLMSVGLPGAPSGGSIIVTHIACAAVIGIDEPQDVLAFILTFEWFWERIRTATNVIGDCFAAKCVESLLIKRDNMQEQQRIDENEANL